MTRTSSTKWLVRLSGSASTPGITGTASCRSGQTNSASGLAKRIQARNPTRRRKRALLLIPLKGPASIGASGVSCIQLRLSGILGPVNKYPFIHPNTDTNIPTFIILPPTEPNNTSATAEAGEAYLANSLAGNTQR